ncbi:MAG: ABC transporter ATP-binding protein [Bacteroidota bacterium]|nr:ABC transporter ATP-binding protein [Bacteroidota bacterium]
MQTSIRLVNVSKKYNNTEDFAVNNINIDIYSGEIFGLLGPNGAGKTTLISMICGLIEPNQGEILIQNWNYHQHRNTILQHCGVVPQEYALYPNLTARENLVFFGSMFGIKGKELNQRLDYYLNKLGLSKFANQKIAYFSGGMKRRVNLIASILHQPQILFLDEPTVGVDIQSKNAIINLLEEINKQGTTIIYTSHHLLEAQLLCNRIAIMENGSIFACDTPNNLICNTPNARNLEDVFISLTGNDFRDAI